MTETTGNPYQNTSSFAASTYIRNKPEMGKRPQYKIKIIKPFEVLRFSKDNIKKMKQQTTEWGKYSQSHI